MTKSESAKVSADGGLKVNEAKWTKLLMSAGWTVVPNVFLERQKALGLDPLDINILLHLFSYWWTSTGKPHPSKKTIAEAMGIDPRTVQRHIARLEKAGLVKREERRISKVGSKSNIYHFDGLIDAAKPFAQEMLETKLGKIAAKDALRAKKGKPKLALVKDED
jgi:predicted transcriptional regulator